VVLASVNDYVHNHSEYGKMPVYNVEGYAVLACNMGSAIVSFYHGAILSEARRYFEAHRAGEVSKAEKIRSMVMGARGRAASPRI
jgi:hypothetical protein